MIRSLLLLIILSGIALLFAPFVVSSLYIDQRSITIPGRVSSMREDVTVHNSSWKRSAEATIQYSPPDAAGVSFYTARLDSEHYDALHKGETVSLHYLRRRDVPALPLSRFLLEMHALPQARLAGQSAFSGLEAFFTPQVIAVCEYAAGLVVILIVLRLARVRLFWWVAGISIALGVTALLVQDFPRPTPRPVIDVRQGTGLVKSISVIDRLFEGSHERGVLADQPVNVIGIEFVPEGRTQSVLAVDLIDSGAIPGLRENSTVAIDYERHSPRTAYIRAGTRNFVSRNIKGIAVQGVLCLAVLMLFALGAHFLGRGYNRLTGAGGKHA